MPGDYILSSEGKRNCHTILSFQPNPFSIWSLGEGVGVGYFQTTRHTFSFQSSVYTKNILVTHFHHNPMVSVFSVKTDRCSAQVRGTQISFYLLILSLMPFPEPCVSKSIHKSHIQNCNIWVRLYHQSVTCVQSDFRLISFSLLKHFLQVRTWTLLTSWSFDTAVHLSIYFWYCC